MVISTHARKPRVCEKALLSEFRTISFHSYLVIAVQFHHAEQMGPPLVIYLGWQCDRHVAKWHQWKCAAE